jgi:hypothetical protein
MSTTQLTQVATNVDEFEVNGDRAIDFDIAANDDYEIQSCVIVDDDNQVVEAAVRFGRIEERPGLGIGKSILARAWLHMVQEATGYDRLDQTAIVADLSDFTHTVPHLRVERENVEAYGLDTLSLDAFAAAVNELATLAEDVLRGDDRTIDNHIDDYL